MNTNAEHYEQLAQAMSDVYDKCSTETYEFLMLETGLYEMDKEGNRQSDLVDAACYLGESLSNGGLGR